MKCLSEDDWISLQVDIETLQKERDIYREAYLKMREMGEFYGNPDSWSMRNDGRTCMGAKDRSMINGKNYAGKCARLANKKVDEMLGDLK